MVGARGFHAIASRRIAAKGHRVVEGEAYPFFYNPMWRFFGDAGTGPPGTYYRRHSDYVEYFWHIFDQVLIRPALLPNFNNEHLRVLTTTGQTDLVTSAGVPAKSVASDHLPLLFRLRL